MSFDACLMAVVLSRFWVALGVGWSLWDPEFSLFLAFFRPFWPDVTSQARRACFGKRRLARGPGKSRRRGVLPGASEARADLAQQGFHTQSLPFSHTSIHSAAGDERDGERGTAKQQTCTLKEHNTTHSIHKLFNSPRCCLIQTRRTKPFSSLQTTEQSISASSASQANRCGSPQAKGSPACTGLAEHTPFCASVFC